MQLKQPSQKTNFSLPLQAFLLNFLIGAAVLVPLILEGNGAFAMTHDFSAEQIPYQTFMVETIQSGNLFWNWSIDLGGNFLESFAFYDIGSVFTWILCLFPSDWIPRLLGWMILLKLGAAGVFSALFFRRHFRKDTTALIASILYTFSGFQCTTIVFFHFMDSIAFFPLLMIGLEELAEEGKRGRFLFACLFNSLCNYVFFLAEAIFLILYYIFIYLLPELKSILHSAEARLVQGRKLLSCIVEGTLGTAGSLFLLLPALLNTMANSRAANTMPFSEWFRITPEYLLLVLKAFFSPAEGMNAFSCIKDADWMANAAFLPLFGMVLVFAYVFSRRDRLTGFLAVLLIFVLVPILNNTFTFFRGELYRRWYYMLILLMALASGKVLEEKEQFHWKSAWLVTAFFLGVLIFFTKFFPWKGQSSQPVFGYTYPLYRKTMLLALISLAVTYPLLRFLKNPSGLITLLAVSVGAFFCFFGAVSGYQAYTDNTNQDFKSHDLSYSENVVSYLTEFSDQLDRDVLPYRYYFDEGIGYTYYNLNLTNSLPSINSFLSTVHPSIQDYYSDIGLNRGTWTNASDLGSRELLGAKYIVSVFRQDEEYKYLSTLKASDGQEVYLYENESALPIGFTYDSYVLKSEMDSVPFEQKQLLMLHALVISEEDEETVSRILPHYELSSLPEYSREAVIAVSEERKLGAAETFTSGDNTFSAVFSSETPRYAFFSVPYDSRWKAEVGGENAEVLNVCGFMAVLLPAGEVQVTFTYCNRIFAFSAALSGASILLSCAWVAYSVLKTKKQRKSLSAVF